MKRLTLRMSVAASVLACAQSAGAVTLVVDLDPVIESTGGSAFVDVNEDGQTDVIMQAENRFGTDASLFDARGGVGNSLFDFDGNSTGDTSGYFSYSSLLVDGDGDLVSLADGTLVDGNTAGDLGASWSDEGLAYDTADLMAGIIPDVGDTAYIGVRIETTEFLLDDGCNGCEFGLGTPAALDTFYAWLQIQHGSLIATAFGYNPTAGGGALVPASPTSPDMAPVPLPAGLPLLLAGLGAFGIMKRRKG